LLHAQLSPIDAQVLQFYHASSADSAIEDFSTWLDSHDRSPQELDISGVKLQVKENTEKSSAVGEMVQNSEVH
jgi:hypothetical protein